MQWLKRNLTLVISGLVTLGLLGGAGFYLFSKLGDEKTSQEALEQKQQQLKALLEKKPFPNKESIEATKTDQVRLKALLDQFQQQFVPVPAPVITNSGKFREQLDNVLFQLQREAQRSEIKLPTNFNFSFTALRPLGMQFETNALKELSVQMTDIRAICGILFESKIYDVLGLRRAAVSTNDQTAAGSPVPSTEYLSRKISTNDWATIYPYEFAVRCTSAELATILDRLAHSPHGFIVKSVKAEAIEVGSAEGDAGAAAPVAVETISRPTLDARMASRYGLDLRSRYGLGRPMQPTPAAPTPTTQIVPTNKMGIILEPRPLRITLLLDVIRPNAEPK
jgi:hypothetical protein